MSGLITAAAITTAGAVGGNLLAADAASKRQDAGFARQDQGIRRLEGLAAGQAEDPRLRLLSQLVERRLINPSALDPRTVELLKARGAADINTASQSALNAIRSRAGASGSIRSGTTGKSEGGVARSLGTGIAQLNRDIDIRAAESQLAGEEQAARMLAALLGIEQQPTRDLANAYLGQGAAIASTPDPWAGFFEKSGTALAGAGSNVMTLLEQRRREAEQKAQFDQILTQIMGPK
jgi:hypothetical protein